VEKVKFHNESIPSTAASLEREQEGNAVGEGLEVGSVEGLYLMIHLLQ
jgi:hypothetical protein